MPFFPNVNWNKWQVFDDDFGIGKTLNLPHLLEERLSDIVVIKRELYAVLSIGFDIHFAFREDTSLPYVQRQIPSQYWLQGMTIMGDKIKFPPYKEPWPWPIKIPGRYDVWGRLNFLLDPEL